MVNDVTSIINASPVRLSRFVTISHTDYINSHRFDCPPHQLFAANSGSDSRNADHSCTACKRLRANMSAKGAMAAPLPVAFPFCSSGFPAWVERTSPRKQPLPANQGTRFWLTVAAGCGGKYCAGSRSKIDPVGTVDGYRDSPSRPLKPRIFGVSQRANPLP